MPARILLILMLFTPIALATTIYQWVDANGHTQLTDTPPPQGRYQRIHYQAPNDPVNTPALEVEETLPAPIVTPKTPQPITVSLVHPHHEQTLRANNGHLSVEVNTSQPLQSHHELQLYLNGHPFGAPSTTPHWHVSNVDRGAHQIGVKLLKDGKVIASSKTVTVYLHRASKRRLPSAPSVPSLPGADRPPVAPR